MEDLLSSLRDKSYESAQQYVANIKVMIVVVVVVVSGKYLLQTSPLPTYLPTYLILLHISLHHHYYYYQDYASQHGFKGELQPWDVPYWSAKRSEELFGFRGDDLRLVGGGGGGSGGGG